MLQLFVIITKLHIITFFMHFNTSVIIDFQANFSMLCQELFAAKTFHTKMFFSSCFAYIHKTDKIFDVHIIWLAPCDLYSFSNDNNFT